jgi:hypothetical protein
MTWARRQRARGISHYAQAEREAMLAALERLLLR